MKFSDADRDWEIRIEPDLIRFSVAVSETDNERVFSTNDTSDMLTDWNNFRNFSSRILSAKDMESIILVGLVIIAWIELLIDCKTIRVLDRVRNSDIVIKTDEIRVF
jgi:hypothetical protein